MDELDIAGMLAWIDAEIAKAEHEMRERIDRVRNKEFAERQLAEFSLAVAPLRKEREVLVTALARVEAFETPPQIIVHNNP